MNPDQPSPPPTQRVSNELAVTQEGEITIFDIKRHPIGLIVIHAASVLLVGIIAALAFAVGPSLSSGNGDSVKQLGLVILLIVGTITIIYNLLATVIYWGNRWILTSDSITQITQNSLFHRESSQLGLSNVEDVTAQQNGILPHIFNYGSVRVETAGERGKFQFMYCPNPNFYAQKVLAAREAVNQNQPHQ